MQRYESVQIDETDCWEAPEGGAARPTANAVNSRRKTRQIKFNPHTDGHDISLSTMDSSELYHVKQQFFLGSHLHLYSMISQPS